MPTKIGDFITFSIRLEGTGCYSLQMTSYRDRAEGIYSLEMGGKEVGRHDFYASNNWEMGKFDVEPGTYRMTFRCVGQNPKSKGLGLKMGNLDFN